MDLQENSIINLLNKKTLNFSKLKDSLVSIIIPTYNRSQIISETLDSILNQTYTNWECIIIDDNSTDNTIQIAKEYSAKDSRFSIKNRPLNKKKGANACRNYGFKISEGNYILFLDSDDILKNTCLEKRLNTFNENSNLDFVIANTAYYQNNEFKNRPICEFPESTTTETYLKYFLSYNLPWTSTMGVLWKRETIQDFEFDENLMRLQDVDYHIKILLAKSHNCYRINEVDNYYRLNEEKSFSEKIVTLNLKALIVFNKTQMKQLNLEKYKKYLIQFNCKMIMQFITPNLKNKKNSNYVLFWLFKSTIYNLKQKTYILLLIFFLNTRLFFLKGIGMNKFRKHFKLVMNL